MSKDEKRIFNDNDYDEAWDNDIDEPFSPFLYPGAFMGGTASANESTGLIQIIPFTPEDLKAYDDLYSYRRTEATSKNDRP